MLSKDNLAAVKHIINQCLNGVCDIYSLCDSVLHNPFTEENYILSAQNIPCHLSYKGISNHIQDNFAMEKQSFTLFLPFDGKVNNHSAFIIKEYGRIFYAKAVGIRFYPSHIEVNAEICSPDFFDVKGALNE